MKKINTRFYELCGLLVIIGLLSSCTVAPIGKLTMVSSRNYESLKNYKLLKNYTLGSNNEKKKSKSKTIDDAINETLKNVAGGEYMTNVTIYLITNGNKKYYAAEGDVWGIEGVIETYRGLAIGDAVQYVANGL